MFPEKIGRYQITSELGRGGMATVYQASDPNFERQVAIKVLPREFLHDPQFRARFEREAKAVASLEHPAIVPVYDFGEDQGQPYIVMRLMSGGSLSERLSKGPLPLDEVAHILGRLAPALDAAHKRGIVHRDLKPGNILFDQYGNAFLSDFGIARMTSGAGMTLTGTGIVGTPAYMSPEQVQGDKEIDGRSDIYALGIILFQMLSGRMPYQADTPAKVMMAHLLEPVPHLLDARPDLPENYEPVVQRALAKDRDQRFATAQEMTTALQAAAIATTQPGTTAKATQVSQPATMVSPGPTRVSPAKREATGPRAVPTLVAGSGAAGADIPLAPPAARPAARFNPLLIVGGLALVAVIVLAAIFVPPLLAGGGEAARQAEASATAAALALAASQTQAAQPTPTLQPSRTPEPSPTDAPVVVPPTNTEPPAPPTDTPEPTLEPSPTATLEPVAPTLGGARQMAFLNANDIYVVNLDGSDLRRLTTDGAAKTNLAFTSDGSFLYYISGKCAQAMDVDTGRVENLLCLQAVEFFEAFAISPDNSRVAISIDRQLFVVPFERETLAAVRFRTGLSDMAQCASLSPYTRGIGPIAVTDAKWSNDSNKLALNFWGASGGIRIDLIQIIDVSRCVDVMPRLDEFPAQRFTIRGYNDNPDIPSFAWDGDFLFVVHNQIRNGGFGDLYIYNSDLHVADVDVRPVGNTCCYRDPTWSPDGSYLAFAFQDIGLGAQSRTQIYYIPYSTIGTGATYQPIPLPEEFFNNPRERPQPVLRPLAP